nr:OmpH family outer membrane protein [Vibrio agarilyticus]
MSASLATTAAEAAQKIGYVNSAQIFQALPQREIALQKMQAEFKDREQELKAIEAKAKTMIEKLQRDGQLMSSEEQDKLKIEIGQLDSQFKIKAQSLTQDSKKREAEETQKLFETIQTAVNKIAKDEGYDMILDARSLSYAKPEYDLSEKVIKALK